MQLDMANFTLQMIKPDIINHSVELEREKFANYLAVQPGKWCTEIYKSECNIVF